MALYSRSTQIDMARRYANVNQVNPVTAPDSFKWDSAEIKSLPYVECRGIIPYGVVCIEISKSDK